MQKKLLQGNPKTFQKTRTRPRENINLFTVINFAEQTMKTLANYGEQLKTQSDYNLTQ